MTAAASESRPAGGLGSVAAGNPDTAAAAVAAFEMGGNAIDAALAAGLASFVAEPLLASAGGGGLMLLRTADGTTRCMDFFPRAPGLGLSPSRAQRKASVATELGGRDFAAVDVDFGSATQRFFVGRASACAPCVLPAFAEAANRYGRLPLRRLVEPAVRLAKSGVVLGRSGAEVFDLLWPIIARDPATLTLLLGGVTELTAQTRTQNPSFADHLERWAQRDGAASPDDDAAVLACAGRKVGGSLTPADLQAARPQWCEAKALQLGAWTLGTCPRPGGVAVASMAQQLAELPAHRSQSELALALAAAGVQADRARLGARSRGSTTQISTLDAQGSVVSMTLSNGEGCGHVVEGSGILLNNFMGEADLNPDGHFAHEPGAPLPTMMSPCIAQSPEQVMAFGSGGANRIRSAVTRVFDGVAHRGLDLQAAICAARVHAEAQRVWFERGGWDNHQAVEAALREAYPHVHPFDGNAFFFGGVHAVQRGPHGVQAVGDARRAGAAAHA